MDAAPQEPTNKRIHHVFMTIHEVTSSISSNQSGCFPVTSNRGNVYVALFYVYSPNYIKSVPIKNRSKEELLRVYMEVYAWLAVRGYHPLLHKLDNKTSHDAKAFIVAEQVKIQYTPPDMHCTNPAKCAVRTWKNHFTMGIAGIPLSFPIANWCQLTPQSNMSLNMMRPCCPNPLLSAYGHATCPVGHQSPCAYQAHTAQVMGLPRRQSVVPLPRRKSLPVHPSDHERHQGQMHHQHIPLPTTCTPRPTHHGNRSHPSSH
jgi:hypothetical protein